jgi:NAD(P)H-nitrite reductase large subunit
MRYVIIGGGVAGLGAIEGIRERDKTGEITLVTNEKHPPYSRPGISYWLSGKLDHDAMPLREEDFYERHGVEILTETEAVAIDTAKKTVTTRDKKTVAYDRLLVATGGAPIVPPIFGADEAEMVFTFTTYQDVITISSHKERMKKAVVVGGGLIGLKAAEALNDIGVDVVVLELMDRILSLAFDEVAGRLVQKRLEESGVEILCGDTAERIETRDGTIDKIITRTGREIDADALILAIGVHPDIKLAQDAGIDVDRGILVDDTLMTSAPDVYAAGDVAQVYDIIHEERRVTPIIPNASRQGKQAGRNMAGAGEKYEGGLSMNAIGFYGLDTISIGLVTPPDDKDYRIRSRLDEENTTYRKLVFRGNALVGAVLVGAVERAGILAGLIRDGVDLSNLEEAMEDPDFGHVHLDKDIRRERLKRS